MKMDTAGISFPMLPVVYIYTQCITREDLKDSEKILPRSSEKKMTAM